jgi:hypothetical protein
MSHFGSPTAGQIVKVCALARPLSGLQHLSSESSISTEPLAVQSKDLLYALPFIRLPQPLLSQPPIILLPVWLEKLLENIALSPERQPKILQ